MMKGKSDLILVFVVIAILLMLFMPLPPLALDMLLILNFSFCLLVLLLTFYSEKPLSFSTFPSLLLITTLFRLGLNISATRLILNDGDAGEVIETVGAHVVGGNYVIGLVVFFILVVVQYVVVTNGAQRVAEVAARFTLDSMPGKQMSIDADLNMGLIDEVQARERRQEVEKEANFYGAMDGATKFVKGDAIAGIIIILIDIIGGLSIGVAQHGMSWNEALHTYTLLTVGDGIVTQIPSLVIATATGIIITRAASDAQLGEEVSKQILSSPKVLYIVAFTLSLTTFLPGLPKLPILVLAGLFAIGGYFAAKNAAPSEESNDEIVTEPEPQEQETLESLLHVSPVEIKLNAKLMEHVKENGEVLLTKLQAFRSQYAKDFGFVIPEVKLTTEKTLQANQYAIYLFNARLAQAEIHYQKYLVIDPQGKFDAVSGINGKEPTYGLPAMWVDEQQIAHAQSASYTVVDPETTLMTHICEVIKSYAYELLTRAETEKLVMRLEKTHSSLIDELIPTVMTYSDVQKVLQRLLKERISIQNMELILEVLVDKGKQQKDIVFLTERVRERLKHQICQPLLSVENTLNVIMLEPRLEQQLMSNMQLNNEVPTVVLDPNVTEALIKQLTQHSEKLISQRHQPVLVCGSAVRYALKELLERVLPQLNIISVTEVPVSVNVQTTGVVSLRSEAA